MRCDRWHVECGRHTSDETVPMSSVGASNLKSVCQEDGFANDRRLPKALQAIFKADGAVGAVKDERLRAPRAFGKGKLACRVWLNLASQTAKGRRSLGEVGPGPGPTSPSLLMIWDPLRSPLLLFCFLFALRFALRSARTKNTHEQPLKLWTPPLRSQRARDTTSPKHVSTLCMISK